MSLTQIAFLISFCFLQIAFILLCFPNRIIQNIQKKFSGRLTLFVIIGLLYVPLFLLGGYIESQDKLYSKLRVAIDENTYSSPESPTIEGDPGLLKWAANQSPSLPRPNFTNIQELRKWQIILRHNLLEKFDLLDINSPLSVQIDWSFSVEVTPHIKRFS